MNPNMLIVGIIAAFIGFLLGALIVWLGVLKIAKAGRADSKEQMDQSLFYMKERNQIDRLACANLGRIADQLEDKHTAYKLAAFTGLIGNPSCTLSKDQTIQNAEDVADLAVAHDKYIRENS